MYFTEAISRGTESIDFGYNNLAKQDKSVFQFLFFKADKLIISSIFRIQIKTPAYKP